MKIKEATVGEIVQSIQGRDKGKFYFVLAVDGEYLYVVDGRKRRLTTPKKKNSKHVAMLPIFHPEIAERIQQGKDENTQIQIAIQHAMDNRAK